MSARILALGPVRHACHSCGNCCTGWRVRLTTMAERERVIAQAAELGVELPIVDGALRRVKGCCIFLQKDRLCAIHARFGESAKPGICRYFPRRTLRAEDGIRVGADPGCSSTWETFAAGPELPTWPVSAAKREPLALALAASEQALVGIARAPGMSIALFAAIITGDHAHLPGLPPAFVTRLLGCLRHTAPYLVDAENGPLVNADIALVHDFLEALDPTSPPPWPVLLPTVEANALDTLARQLFLRLGDDAVPPIAQALLILGGIMACAMVDPSPPVFGRALAAWSRLCRLEKFWCPVMPNPESGRWILTGRD